MEMAGRRLGYTILSQSSDDPPTVEKNRGKAPSAAAFDWLQRQSSGSSYEGSSVSGDCYPTPTLPSFRVDSAVVDASEKEEAEAAKDSFSSSSSSCLKSWAQQAEEAYQLQLALALRLCSEAATAPDPNFLDAGDQIVGMQDISSAESVSHRFWVTGCLSYYDKVPDGFYLIQGMDPFIWTLCNDVQEGSRVPSIESLKTIRPSESSIEVGVIDKIGDIDLRQLQKMASDITCNCATPKDIADQLARLVCTRMGGVAFIEECELLPRWKDCSEFLKANSGSVVLPVGRLSVGLCRHRAILFKTLADSVNLPCRVVRGCKYCKSDDATSCLVRFGLEREYLVDLVGDPGNLCEPNSLLNGLSSIFVCSPLRLPKYKSLDISDNFRSLAKQYFLDCQSLNLMFNDVPAGTVVGKEDVVTSYKDLNSPQATSSDVEASRHLQRVTQPNDKYGGLQPKKLYNPSPNLSSLEQIVQDQNNTNMTDISRFPAFADLRDDKLIDSSLHEKHQFGQSFPLNNISLAVDDLIIPWSELVLKEKIGAGSFGTVHRADWNGSDVAVKILMELDFHPECLKEFLREVAIMKSLRHPNIVLLMGAVTQPPSLSIVTEYLSRGSLYRLLHRHGARENLDEKRCLNMAFDVAKGMNYLHKRNPPIVHRDLKSPNLLVDKKYTVKVCDFGLSRLKANTFLSSKTAAGTPEWMAPEVLRDELSNEKSDVYSFGVILWELMTLQQPWGNLNPAQVVAAVGFNRRRLDIPSELNPQVSAIIESCWDNEPWKRPSFSSIMESLKPLGFHKVHADRWEFANEGFLRGNKPFLKNISRRRSSQVQQVGFHVEPSVEMARSSLEGQVRTLKGEKSIMIQEVSRLQQENLKTLQQMNALNQRMQSVEQRQKQMVSFFAKVVQNPMFFAQIKQQKQKREIASMRVKRKFLKQQQSGQRLLGEASLQLAEEERLDSTVPASISGLPDIEYDVSKLPDYLLLDMVDKLGIQSSRQELVGGSGKCGKEVVPLFLGSDTSTCKEDLAVCSTQSSVSSPKDIIPAKMFPDAVSPASVSAAPDAETVAGFKEKNAINLKSDIKSANAEYLVPFCEGDSSEKLFIDAAETVSGDHAIWSACHEVGESSFLSGHDNPENLVHDFQELEFPIEPDVLWNLNLDTMVEKFVDAEIPFQEHGK
ncbi:serine/threonine-protein kinase CTR1-like isoform X2 [Typha angustifolia]|uniref:serine/threonine-protein kinase CTR1-like isoform X2 n=1 Tax=Typha angustifolia TaxID=59011 RepID=UPI003C2D6B73